MSAPGVTRETIAGIWSPQLRNRRTVDVYLPPSYDATRDRYPVLYMQDGQNLSDPAIAFAGTWCLPEVLADLARGGLDVIVVGVHHRGGERINEYSPFADRRYGPGHGDRYLTFLVSALKPRIDRRFRTKRAREHTAILGSSMGGLISLHALFTHPRVFGAAGAMSPALWIGNRGIFDGLPRRPRGRIYLDMGTEEGAVALRDARAMADRLEQGGYRPQQSLLYLEQPGGRHCEAHWSQRLGRAITFLFSEG